jgi:acetolactate synthase I/II/III large subunit
MNQEITTRPRPKTSIAPALSEHPVGDAVAAALADMGVTTVFGVISIHNMPILDAIGRHGRIRFVPARGEAGAMNMADAFARVSRSLGVVITSTGTAAGNAAGSQVEALTAGSPVLHITTQVDREFMDLDRAAIHDVPRQPDMLKAVSKHYVRVREPVGAIDALLEAAVVALTAPSGPVTLEIPVDVQRLKVPVQKVAGVPAVPLRTPDPRRLDALADMVRQAKRPMLWLGGGARGAVAAATALAQCGFGIVTSTNGRAVVPERHAHSLGAFNMSREAEQIYAKSDLMIVVGSRLRGNETQNNKMRLPRLVQIDADPLQAGRNYPVELFIAGDARLALEGLLSRLPDKLATDPDFLAALGAARAAGEAALRKALGPYAPLADALSHRVERGGHPWVRDVTVSNSTFGNRHVILAEPRLGVHALGGGIGQGIAMGIGAAAAGGAAKTAPKTITLLGDGGAQLMLGELATAAESRANVVYVMMNDRGYGVIRNIQDAQYEGRRMYADILTPDFALICRAVGLPHVRITRVEDFEPALDRAIAAAGPQMIEVDMIAIGPFGQKFAGPPAGAAGQQS